MFSFCAFGLPLFDASLERFYICASIADFDKVHAELVSNFG